MRDRSVTKHEQFEPVIAKLMEFYDCNSYRDLVLCQASHVERLQEKLAAQNPFAQSARPSRPREG